MGRGGKTSRGKIIFVLKEGGEACERLREVEEKERWPKGRGGSNGGRGQTKLLTCKRKYGGLKRGGEKIKSRGERRGKKGT